jgi:hypothetical protein
MMPWEIFNLPPPEPSASKGECVCRNHSLPVNGIRYVSPSCPIHYSQLTAFATAPKIEPGLDSLKCLFPNREWVARQTSSATAIPAHKKRVTYPKMTVAKRQLLAN